MEAGLCVINYRIQSCQARRQQTPWDVRMIQTFSRTMDLSIMSSIKGLSQLKMNIVIIYSSSQRCKRIWCSFFSVAQKMIFGTWITKYAVSKSHSSSFHMPSKKPRNRVQLQRRSDTQGSCWLSSKMFFFFVSRSICEEKIHWSVEFWSSEDSSHFWKVLHEFNLQLEVLNNCECMKRNPDEWINLIGFLQQKVQIDFETVWIPFWAY